MKSFSQFNIKPRTQGFLGDKIKIDRVLNKEIVVHAYKIEPSKYDKGGGTGKCLHLQISLGDSKHVVFVGSTALMDLIEQVPKENFPFTTVIIKDNNRLEFT